MPPPQGHMSKIYQFAAANIFAHIGSQTTEARNAERLPPVYLVDDVALSFKSRRLRPRPKQRK